MTTTHRYEFGPFCLDPAERRLLRDGEPVSLTPKCFDLLVVFVENAGHLLEKGDLLARVWPGQFVEEGSLSFNVSELRKALGEGQTYIETVRKKGFRFVAVVQREERTANGVPVLVAQPARRAPSRRKLAAAFLLALAALALLAYLVWPGRRVTAVEEHLRSVAVLPFQPLAATSRDEPLEMGICDALTTRLATLEQLVVRPTSSVVRYNRVGQDPLVAGRELRVDAVLEGYIQRSGDRIRVTARLLRTADGKSLWSGQFNEPFTDIFSIEDSISRQIVQALHVSLTSEQRRRVTKHATENSEAYQLYLKGRYFYDKRTAAGLTKSVAYLEEATAKDPSYALAFAALANSYVVLAVRADMPPKDSYRNARAAATRALEIDETTAEAHSALGNVRTWYDWDWPGAEREFKRAIELGSNDPITYQQYATFLMVVGRPREAMAAIKHAQDLEPLSLQVNVQAARVLFFSQQYDAALEQCRRSLDLDPEFGPAYLFVGRIHAQKGSYSEAIAALSRARTLVPDSAEVLALIGSVHASGGHPTEARQMLEELRRLSKEKYVSPYHVAMIHAGLGENDAAFAELEKAYDDREGRMTILRFAPEFASLRTDARFTRLLQRMKLV
ncbi:MAG: winged helix-turn-helix domain-containing protein [Thermoanaerobaculia bacterium]